MCVCVLVCYPQVYQRHSLSRLFYSQGLKIIAFPQEVASDKIDTSEERLHQVSLYYVEFVCF